MSILDGSQLLHKGSKSLIYHSQNEEDSEDIIIKVLNVDYPSVDEILSFNNEFEILKSIDSDKVRKAYKVEKIDGKNALELEYFDGLSLSEFITTHPIGLSDFFTIAIALTKGLSEIHESNVIHKNISPQNILVHPDTYDVKYIDFSISSRFNLKQSFLESTENQEGSLRYISPEQTGRMNRTVDYRTDFYSLGILFYELLTSQYPYSDDSVLQLIHSHIAKQPALPNEINKDIPKNLSSVVMKLLEKDAEDRYQSTFGILADLEKLYSNPETDSFTPGENDYSGKFKIAQKLYGRENEIKQLQDAFDRTSKGGNENFFVGGFSGSGKSALISEVHKSITLKSGKFISGKCEQFQRSIPYFPWIQALNELVNQMLVENNEDMDIWKKKILDAIGSSGKVLLDLEPKLELIIGEQPDLPILTGEDAQNRFNYVFQSFIRAIAKKNHPLIIFLDDLQWADNATLKLLKLILTSESMESLLFIGAFRDNEVEAGHPFALTLNEIEEEGSKITDIRIGNLSEKDIQDLVFDSLDQNKNFSSLAALVLKKTQGNAFYVNSFLNSLYQEELLKFDYTNNQWTWNEKQVNALSISENVGEFMVGILNKLPDETKDILKLAASIGNEFSSNLLALLAEIDIYKLQYKINEALSEGLLIPLGKLNYKFAHDQIQYASYSLIPEKERPEIHLKIGKLLKQSFTEREEDYAGSLFDIVNHLNNGVSLIHDYDEKIELSNLNLAAGERAQISSAYDAGYNYLSIGISLLPESSWAKEYNLTLGLYTELVKVCALSNRFEELDKNAEIVFNNANTILDKIPVYEVMVHSYSALNEYEKSLGLGLEALKQLGENFPAKPSKLDILNGLIKTRFLLGRSKIAALAYQEMMTNEIKLAANRIIVSMGTSAMFGNPDLLPLLALRVVQLAIKYGNTPQITRGYAGYAMILCGGVGDIKSGYEFGKLAVNSVDTIENSVYKAAAVQIHNTCIRHYREHLAETLQPLKNAYIEALETGDLEAADFAISNHYFHRYFVGDNLETFINDFKDACDIVEKHQRTQVLNLSYIYYQTAYNLIHNSEEPWMLIGEEYNEEDMLPQHLKSNDATALFIFYYHKLTLAYLFENFEKAREYSVKARQFIEGGISLVPSVLYFAFDSLCRLADFNEQSASDQRKNLRIASSNNSKFKKFVGYSPENYLALYYLVKAEIFRVKNKNESARTFYDKAIEKARETNYNNIQALANELAGKHLLAVDLESVAQFYLNEAYQQYYQWGAKAKLEEMELKFKKHLYQQTSTGSNDIANIDLNSILKASQTITEEISLPKLLSGVMKVAIENAGAQRGLLILKEENDWLIECITEPNSEPQTLQSIPINEAGGKSKHALLSSSVFDYVIRTGQSVVLNDASDQKEFSQSEYILQNKPKSILCTPLIKQGQIVGCLYLENNLTTGAFTPERVEILDLLTSQIAISLENSRLYENLEEKVKFRTKQLEEEKEKSEKLLLNILPKETVAELKEFGYAKSRSYETASILFTDFKGFTSIAEKMPAEEVVKNLDYCFKAFDKIIKKHNLEKIKTIGDSYMCVGGIPIANKTNPKEIVEAALEMVDFMKKWSEEKVKNNEPAWELRLGIHTGRVVTGVVGEDKFAYDIWGDAVNTASRMESSGEPGRVNISGDTYEHIKDLFKCTHRGKIKAKNKGEVDMYFVDSPK